LPQSFAPADPKRFQEVLKSALWKDSVLRLKAQAQVGGRRTGRLWVGMGGWRQD
jgi:hypothetical protein